jgi:hypothetical protein
VTKLLNGQLMSGFDCHRSEATCTNVRYASGFIHIQGSTVCVGE